MDGKQIYPPSITGKGSRFAPGAACSITRSARATRTRSASRRSTCCSTAETFDLVQHIDTVLAAVAGHELEPRDQRRADAVRARDRDARLPHDRRGRASSCASSAATSAAIARERGMRVGSAGTHPFSLFERQRITARDRYRALVDQMQYVARRELIFGMHIHVAVDDPDKAIQVVNGLLPHLAPLLALSASSPFWRGEPTGLALEPADGLRGVPALGAAAALPRATPTTRRSSASSRRPAASPTTRTSGGTSGCTRGSARSRSGSATRSRASRTSSRSSAYCQALVKLFSEQLRARRGDPVLPPHPHDREQVARRRATGSRRR